MNFFDGFWFAMGCAGAITAIFVGVCAVVAVMAFFDTINKRGGESDGNMH